LKSVKHKNALFFNKWYWHWCIVCCYFDEIYYHQI